MSEEQASPFTRRRPLAADITPLTPIWCNACQEHHSASEFHKDSSARSGLDSYCKVVRAALAAKEYSEGGKRERQAELRTDPAWRARRREWARQYRAAGRHRVARDRIKARLQAAVIEWKAMGCCDCGYTDPRALDADHVELSRKTDNIGSMVAQFVPIQRLLDELEKCEVRCVRCHRRRTEQQIPARYLERDAVPPSWQAIVENRARSDRLKLERGCVDCGWHEWARGLDWDHLGVKRGNVATMIKDGWRWRDIAAEIANCEVRCANCHRIKTLERLAEKKARKSV